MTGPRGVSASDARVKRPLWRRPGTWIALLVIAIVVWLLGSVALAGWHARKASAALSAVASQIRAGDVTVAAGSIETARSNTEAARSAVTSPPVSLLRIVPYFRTNLTGADAFMGAALEVLDAADATREVYPLLSGADHQGRAVFRNGKVNLKVLERAEPGIAQASESLTRATDHLDQVPPDASPFLRRYVDEASDQISGLETGLRVYGKVSPELPALLGENEPATYLVVFNNPAELYAGGGAILNVALLQFDNGKMRVVDRGDMAHFYPIGQRVPWNPVAGGPYYAESGASDGFAWSNLHQDFRVAGEDIMRSWQASGGQPVDGVISLDPVALQAAVAATGPVKTKFYGKITADNLVQKLFVEGYNDDPVAQERRHQVNQRLIDEMLARMQQGDTALTVGRAILATAPGHHVRVHLSDNRLADALHEAKLDGAQPDPEPDRIAFFTQNQNSSKVDVFQRRRVTHNVYLQDDGSAKVVQTAKVTIDVPKRRGDKQSARTGYTTRWAFHWNIALLPENADDVKLTANAGEIKTDDRVFTDVDGRSAVRIGRWIPPGGTSRITLSYHLPAGTFGSDGNLLYRAGVEHQLTIQDVEMTVNVHGPSEPTPVEGSWVVTGDRATTQFPVTQPTTVALQFEG